MNTFDDFWRDYPRKVSKKDAMRAWEKAVKVELPSVIIAGLQRQLEYLNSRPMEFRPHAATWLNGWRWEDEVQTAVAPPQREQSMAEFMRQRLERANNDAERENGTGVNANIHFLAPAARH